jgi:outer membrane immunogenic protein
VIGPEATYWRASNWSQNCSGGDIGGSICHKSFEEFGAAIRAGYLVTPSVLVFGKGGYVSNEQRKRFDAPVGETSYYNHGRADGYQVGGGVEYSLTQVSLPLPVYVDAQYVYSRYDDHTSRQRLMAGVGVRFK